MKEGSALEIHVKGPCGQEITGKTMEAVISFLYSDTVDLHADNIFDVLLASDYMQIISMPPIFTCV